MVNIVTLKDLFSEHEPECQVKWTEYLTSDGWVKLNEYDRQPEGNIIQLGKIIDGDILFSDFDDDGNLCIFKGYFVNE